MELRTKVTNGLDALKQTQISLTGLVMEMSFVMFVVTLLQNFLFFGFDHYPTEYPLLMKGTCLKDHWLCSVDIYLH